MKQKLSAFLLPLSFAVIMLTLIQTGLIHKLFGIKELQLPLPLNILQAVKEDFSSIFENTLTTLKPAIPGMLLGILFGYMIAAVVTALPAAGYGCLILAAAINAIPVIALAPLMNRWFVSPFLVKLVVITVINTGTITVGAYKGMNALAPHTLDMMKSYNATSAAVFRKLRLKNSLPYLFTSLKINVAVTIMGTIICEYFASETSGLGYMIKYLMKVGNRRASGWAYIMTACAVSLLLYGLICLLERLLLRWHVTQRN